MKRMKNLKEKLNAGEAIHGCWLNSGSPMNAEIVLTLDKKDVLVLKDVLSDLKDVSNACRIEQGKFGVEVLN